MLLGIDHLVIAVPSVDDAASELERDLGLSFTGGGRHEAMGTYNRLAFLGDPYVELIGVFDAGLVRRNPAFAVGGATLDRLEAHGAGLVTYAVTSDGLGVEVEALHASGSPIGDVIDGARTRPDGETVRWRMAFPPVLGPDRPPFLIEHELTGAEWGDAARGARAAFRHPGGGRLRLGSLELPVVDPPAVAEAYGTTLGIAFSEGWRTALGGQAIEVRRDGRPPVVRLTAEPGSAGLDIERVGVRWVREPGDDEPHRR